MERRWREYMGGPAVPSRNDIYTTLNNKGEIILNRHAFDAMGRPEYAVMLFEPETDSVGVRAMETRVPNAFELQPKGNCDNRLIRAKSFCTDHEINFGCTVRFYGGDRKRRFAARTKKDRKSHAEEAKFDKAALRTIGP